MKVISVLIFAVALVATWSAAHSKRLVSESVHAGIQSDLRNIITEYVQKNVPASQNLRFEKMWTETLSKDKVRARFLYSFEDKDEKGEPVVIQINGTALLNKAGETAELVTWNLDELRIEDNTVNFTEPIQITAGAGELENGEKPTESDVH